MEIHLEIISSLDSPFFPIVKDILEKSFIPDERREYTTDLLLNKHFRLNAVLYNNSCIGLLASSSINE